MTGNSFMWSILHDSVYVNMQDSQDEADELKKKFPTQLYGIYLSSVNFYYDYVGILN